MAAAKPTRRTNPVILRQGMTIGSNAAETDDEFLFDCFINYPPVETCIDVHAPGMVLVGRTGAGKTGIIRWVAKTCEHTIQVDPSDMAMGYVSNSDALNFLRAIGADLDHLFQVLWKHVICIEYIRLRFCVIDEERSKSVFAALFERFHRDARKQKSIQYLRSWEGKFWITMDENIKELTSKVEDKINAEFGSEIQKFKARGQYEKQLSSEKKSELVTRSRKIINPDQIAALSGVIQLLSEEAGDHGMNKFYILIDKLDERWVDSSLRFRMIRALLESLKTFRKITNLKIIVALRSDILARVIQETRDSTSQLEKIEDYFIYIKWNKQDLKELVQKRLRFLFKRKYTQDGITFEDIFQNNIASKDPFDYILHRTLMRPRDVISFINECLKVSENAPGVTAANIRKAEMQYAHIRRKALEEEWYSVYPTLENILNYIGSLKKLE